MATAGIQIANLDQTVFSDLSTLRDKGGASAFAIGSDDIDVVMADVISKMILRFKQEGQSQETGLSWVLCALLVLTMTGMISQPN